ncbi:MAG: hypothetical protein KAU38_11030 [Desulfobacterales bacterium]|nr:hypothetical protein [Desulfobacterales bacterium]
MELARKYLLVAGGHANRCGDNVTLIRCLEGLATLFATTNEKKLEKECYEEVHRISNVLGMRQSASKIWEGQIIKDCEAAAKREMRKVIVGEAILVVASSTVLGGIACIFLPTFWSRVGTFVLILLVGAGVKLWNGRKRFIKYTHIDRS